MEEIKVGEYIRTNKGYITQVIDLKRHYTKGKRLGIKEEVTENYLNLGRNQVNIIDSIDYTIPPCYPSDEELEVIKKAIAKHNSNIMDLIKVGDYVNGEPVEQVTEFEITTTTQYLTNPKDIKSICTREQFESVEYKLDN